MTKIKSELGLHSLIVPAPAFGLRMVLGEMANVVLDSTRVIPKYLLDKGFKFSFDDPGKAVEDLLSKGI
jgi:NAD dependent epimerase/dehydratase family enzyme